MESVARALVPANYVKHDGLGVAHRREPMAELLPVSPSLGLNRWQGGSVRIVSGLAENTRSILL